MHPNVQHLLFIIASIIIYHSQDMAFHVAQTGKNLPAMQETGVRSLSWEDPLEKGMATHSSILAWRIPWTETPGRLQSMGLHRVRHNWATNTHKIWNHPKCPSTDEWIKKMWYTHTHTYIYTHTYRRMPLNHTKNEILPFATTQMDLESTMLSEISQKKNTLLSLICGI